MRTPSAGRKGSSANGFFRRCVTNAPTVEEVRCFTEDEGWPLEAGGQAQASNPRKLRS